MFAQSNPSLHFQCRRFTVLSVSQDFKSTKMEKNPSWNPLLFPPAMHHTVHCDKCPPGSCVPALRVPSEPTAAAVPTAPAPAAPDPLPQGQPLLSCSWERAQGAAGWIPEHPPEAVPIPQGTGGCPGLPQGAPSSGGCTGRCFGASAPPATRDVSELCQVPFLLVFRKN